MEFDILKEAFLKRKNRHKKAERKSSMISNQNSHYTYGRVESMGSM